MYPRLPRSAHFNEEHDAFRETVKRFVDKELLPHVNAWDEAEAFPRGLYGRAAELGLLGMGFPEQYGGTPGDLFHEMAMIEELSRTGCGGLMASLFSHTIGAPPIAQICMLKNLATRTLQFCADNAVQILDGMGFMRGTKSERIYREVKVYMIGGGAEEVLNDLAARQLGWS